MINRMMTILMALWAIGCAPIDEADDQSAVAAYSDTGTTDDSDSDDDDTSPPVTTPETITVYGDSDGDGYGNIDNPFETTEPIPGYVANSDDCDDADATVNPSRPEVCDGIDNDCDGLIDDADPSNLESTARTWYFDGDGDGYGDTGHGIEACTPSSNWVTDDNDCDDSNGTIYPGAPEIAEDGIDQNCDGYDNRVWYYDADRDGYGDPGTISESATMPTGYVANSDDCNDGNDDIHPRATEVCDGIDNDCDVLTDDADPDLNLWSAEEWFQDSDGDGYGDEDHVVYSCIQPFGTTDDDSDCDDGDEWVYPHAKEYCDEIDNDCDGDVDELTWSIEGSSGWSNTDWIGGMGDHVGVCDTVTMSGGFSDGSDATEDECGDYYSLLEHSLGSATHASIHTYIIDSDGDIWGIADATLHGPYFDDGVGGEDTCEVSVELTALADPR